MADKVIILVETNRYTYHGDLEARNDETLENRIILAIGETAVDEMIFPDMTEDEIEDARNNIRIFVVKEELKVPDSIFQVEKTKVDRLKPINCEVDNRNITQAEVAAVIARITQICAVNNMLIDPVDARELWVEYSKAKFQIEWVTGIEHMNDMQVWNIIKAFQSYFK